MSRFKTLRSKIIATDADTLSRHWTTKGTLSGAESTNLLRKVRVGLFVRSEKIIYCRGYNKMYIVKLPKLRLMFESI